MECIFNGEILKRLRIKMGVNQEQIARQTNLSNDTISNLERGKDSDPHLSTVARLADYFDVSIDLFCDRDKYYYADQTSKKMIKYIHLGLFKKELLKHAFKIYQNPNDEVNRKRIEVLRKIYTGNSDLINSIYHLICE